MFCNIASSPRVRLKLRHGILARWHTGTAHLLADDDPQERQRWLASQVRGSARNAAVVRLGTELLTVRIDLEQKIVRVCGNQRRRSKNSAPPPTFGGSLRRSIVLARCATMCSELRLFFSMDI